jgi:hypothetical protein
LQMHIIAIHLPLSISSTFSLSSTSGSSSVKLEIIFELIDFSYVKDHLSFYLQLIFDNKILTVVLGFD